MQTVLIVTDDAEAASRLADVLAALPCDVALAADGGRACHLMEVLAFDVVLVDAGSNGFDAAPLAAELRRRAVGGTPRFVAVVRTTERMPRGFDAQVSLAAGEAELARAVLSEATGAAAGA